MDAKTLEDRANEMAEFILPMIDSKDKTHDVIDFNKQKIHYLNTTAGILILLNKLFPEKEYKELLTSIWRETRNNYNIIFYKDEETYFKSAAFKKIPEKDDDEYENENNVWKKHVDDKKPFYHKKTLDEYKQGKYAGAINRIISPSVPEAERIKNTRHATYFLPKEGTMSGKLQTYKFWEVVNTHSNISGRPAETVAKDCSIWVERVEHNGILIPPFKLLRSTEGKLIEDYKRYTPMHANITDNRM